MAALGGRREDSLAFLGLIAYLLNALMVFVAELVGLAHAFVRLVQAKRHDVAVLVRMHHQVLLAHARLDRVAFLRLPVVVCRPRLELLQVFNLVLGDTGLWLHADFFCLLNHRPGQSKFATRRLDWRRISLALNATEV